MHTQCMYGVLMCHTHTLQPSFQRYTQSIMFENTNKTDANEAGWGMTHEAAKVQAQIDDIVLKVQEKQRMIKDLENDTRFDLASKERLMGDLRREANDLNDQKIAMLAELKTLIQPYGERALPIGDDRAFNREQRGRQTLP